MISDYALLDQVLAQISDAAGMAVLHREAEVAGHAVVTDVDLCVATDPLSIIAGIAPRLRSEGILPILGFHYDRGSYSFFFANSDGTGGAQVDLLHDPKGVARYGVRTDALLTRRCEGVRWPRIDRLDEALYVLRKRQLKCDTERLTLARNEVMTFGSAEALRRTSELFGRRAAAAVTAELTRSGNSRLRRTSVWRSRIMRPSRVLRRCGYWTHVTGDTARTEAHQLSADMSRLISASTVVNPSLLFLLANLWRPRLIVSSGDSRFWPRPDSLLGSNSSAHRPPRDLAAPLVAAMNKRVLSTFQLESRNHTHE